jgi:hypothetical protein
VLKLAVDAVQRTKIAATLRIGVASVYRILSAAKDAAKAA